MCCEAQQFAGVAISSGPTAVPVGKQKFWSRHAPFAAGEIRHRNTGRGRVPPQPGKQRRSSNFPHATARATDHDQARIAHPHPQQRTVVVGFLCGTPFVGQKIEARNRSERCRILGVVALIRGNEFRSSPTSSHVLALQSAHASPLVPNGIRTLSSPAKPKFLSLRQDTKGIVVGQDALPSAVFRNLVFSFHATKFLNTAEGGAVLTNDDAFAESCRRLRNFGFAGEDKVLSIGTNGKMSELHASMGIASLEKLPEFIAANQRNYAEYAAALASVPGFNLLPYDAHESNNYQYVVVDVDERSGLDRDQWHALLHAENLMARRYFYPGCHRMEPYRTLYSDAGLRLPRTEHACSRILCLPTGTAVGPDEIRDTCELLSFAAHNAAELRSRWPLPMPGAETQW